MCSVVIRESGRRAGLGTTLVAAVAVAAVGGLLAGCSSSGSSSAAVSSADQAVNSSDALSANPMTAVRSAADITGRAGYVQDTTTLETVSAGKRMVLHGTAQYNYSTRLGRMWVTIPPGEGTTGKLTEVFAPGVVYMQNDGAKGVPPGKWVEVNLQELADGNLVSSGATDPASAANALRGAQTAVLLGSQTVGGVVLKHYQGTLDLAQAAEATGGGAGTGLTLAAKTFTVKKVPYQVWLDRQGRINKIVEVFTFTKVPGSAAAKDQVVVTSTSAFSGYGSPVSVSVPASKDIYDAPSAGASAK